MVSAEPLTLTPRGYPELLQAAEPYRGGTLTDRQHPHELISELSVGFEHPVGSRVGASLYAAPVGEPDRKSTRLNSSHGYISYAVFCLKKKKKQEIRVQQHEPRLDMSAALAMD